MAIAKIRIKGIVQGVGFRPFVYRLGQEIGLRGWVLNDTEGVLALISDDEEDGAGANATSPETTSEDKIVEFCLRLKLDAPPMAVVDSVEVVARIDAGSTGGARDNAVANTEKSSGMGISSIDLGQLPEAGFRILPSPAGDNREVYLSPDIATCADCRRELLKPADRRYRYPFINCTNCGPRYSIIQKVPYDRPNTTMKKFRMCPKCQREYENPMDRRFHAQPDACGDCGPRYRLLDNEGNALENGAAAISTARRLLAEGRILAVKGIGGYHLACDARNEAAVHELRRRKHRWAKPLAVMAGSLAEARRLCNITAEEEQLLTSSVAPIVLACKKKEYDLVEQVAPDNAYLGVMLPYAPIHYLLLEEQEVLVMTSANISEEPIVYRDEEAVERLGRIADAFLTHDREIANRVDDSVVRVVEGQRQLIRRSRGMAPAPIRIKNKNNNSVLACGAELKNTFCVTKPGDGDSVAFVSEHIGDLANMPVFESYKGIIEHYKEIFNIEPKLLACDMHPEYLSTKYAHELAKGTGIPLIEVQHHHAHIAGVLAEHLGDKLTDGTELTPHTGVIGIAMDGTGYGDDGKIWGGEFFVCSLQGYTRMAHFKYVPLCGGEKAVKEPWRLALWELSCIYGDAEAVKAAAPYFTSRVQEAISSDGSKAGRPEHAGNTAIMGWPLLLQAARAGLNSPLTSSAGRLFDAAGAILGICPVNHYEGQSAIMLEQMANRAEWVADISPLPYNIEVNRNEEISIDLLPAFRRLIEASEAAEHAVPISCMPRYRAAYAFHLTIAELLVKMSNYLRKANKELTTVAMAGGVFQNRLLMELALPRLKKAGFKVLLNKQVPPNDGGLSLGQAAVALEKMKY